MSYPNSEEDNNQPNEEQVSAQKDILLKQILSGEARLRLNNVKMVKPELAIWLRTISLGWQHKEKHQVR